MTGSHFSKLKPIEWLLALLLLAAPLYFHPNVGGTGLRIPNNIMVWFIATCICCYSLYKLASQHSLQLPRYFVFIGTFPIAMLLSSFVAGIESAEQWTFRSLFVWGGLLFLFSLYQHQLKQGRIDRILLLVVLSGLIHALVGLAQIVLIADIPSWLPYNPHGIPTGLFQQINNQASFQVTSIIIALWLVSRPTIRYAKPRYFYLLLLAIGCGAFVVSYSGSRIAALAFIIALPLLLVSRWNSVKTDKKRWLCIAVILISASTTANIIEDKRGFGLLLDKTRAMNAGFSGSARLGIYAIAYQVFTEEPIFGHGIGSFVRVWQLAKPAFYQQHPDAKLPNQRVGHPHNELILWLIEGGSVAGIGLGVVLIGLLLLFKRLPPSRRYAYLALILPLILHTQVELPFYISASHWFVFLILLFVIMAPYQQRYSMQLSLAARKLLKVIAMLVFVTTTLFLAHSIAANLEFKRHLLKQAPLDNRFAIALTNPYFQPLALETMMTALASVSIEYGIDDNIPIFTDWVDQELKLNPHIHYYQLAVQAKQQLGEQQHACTIAAEGLAIYPDDEQLQTIHAECNGESITLKHTEL